MTEMPTSKPPASDPSAQKPPERVYCTYCGKGFSRKEHLERHLPTHTNVKPHVCCDCSLSFSRRQVLILDLLQRHYSTYHETKDPMNPSLGGLPPAAGRTPIACQNCASAKTGCDKKVPCTRCAEKNLPCEARFARRSSKAAIRAAQANAALQNTLSGSTQQSPSSRAATSGLHGSGRGGVKMDGIGSPTALEIIIPGTQGHGSPQEISPHHPHLHFDGFSPPHLRIDGGLDDFAPLGNEYVAPDTTTYQDYLSWSDYHMDLDDYQSGPQLGRQDTLTHGFGNLSNTPSPSDLVIPSLRTTPGTSIISAEYEPVIKPSEFGNIMTAADSVPDFEVIIAAEAGWNLARCNPTPPVGSCPRTAIVHLECLEQKSKQEGTWSALEQYMEQLGWDTTDLGSVVPLTSRTRDKILAITQSFLHKALDIHRSGISGYPKAGYMSPSACNFIVLPPTEILEHFLRSYVRSLSVYYPLVVAGCVDPNEMLQNNQASTLLVLLMIAQGAAAMPILEARQLSAGLTETCRISLFDIVEKDVELSADPTTLRCALLFLVLGAWSGDKWLMDIAMGQRGMYMSMLKHAGMLEPQLPTLPNLDSVVNTELQWRAWVDRETRNRLVYNYVMLDQELSLFHDVAPSFAITDLRCPLPAPELLWMSTNSGQWYTAMQSLYGHTSNVNPQLLDTRMTAPSLHELFQDFLQDNLSNRHPGLSPQQLRLLLHPLQAMICHLRQILSCFTTVFDTPHINGISFTRASMMHRLEEVEGLLQRWYDIATDHVKTDPDCPVTQCSLVLYHLISLNAVTDFPEIERLARREDSVEMDWELSMRHTRCIFQRQKAIMHSGQTFRLLRLMPKDRRPVWWPVAMYRATLVLWADSVSKHDTSSTSSGVGSDKRHSSGNLDTQQQMQQDPVPVVIDQLTPEDPALMNFLWNRNGVPILMHPSGTPVGLEKPGDILTYAVKSIEGCYSSRMGDGIKRKLMTLGEAWNPD
ncbi:hypothetical protein B0J18DRAFT_476445, partial [Chaetomium sp. MPI-SDFR-AT-0129]